MALPPACTWVLLVLPLALGCATKLDAQDHSVLFPTLRVSKRLDEHMSINLFADYAAGSDTASGSTGTPIVVGGVSFPGNVNADFDLTTVRIEARGRHDISPKLLVEGFAGAAFYYVDVTVSSGNASGHEDRFEAGPHFGGRIGWRPAPRFQVYGETYLYYPFPDGIVANGAVEVGVEYEATGPVKLLGGWRWRNLELILEDSDFDFEWSGPFLGLAFDF
jgi:hypothetical protein